MIARPGFPSTAWKVRLLLDRHRRELRTQEEAVDTCHTRVREAIRESIILRAKLEAIEGVRAHEILALRTAGRDAVDSLKVGVVEAASHVCRYQHVLCVGVVVLLRCKRVTDVVPQP